VIAPRLDEAGNHVRWIVGLIVLFSLVLPLFWIVRARVRGERGRPLLKAIWRPILAAIFILAVALILMLHPDLWKMGWIGVVLAVIPLVEVIRILLDWLNERFIITNRRVMEVRGTINKHVRDSALEKVNDVELDQSFVGRILNYGTVEIITGSDIGVNQFHRISNPTRFKRAMLNAKEEMHTGAPAIEAETFAASVPAAPAASPLAAAILAPATTAATPATGTAAPDSSQIPDLIADLDALRQKGIISEEEFQAKKAELLKRL
jgi:uncharacterized membrane protein YdbT with pleckstrin-like domain